MKSEGKPGNGSPKPDRIKDAGSVLSPEKCIVVDCKDNLCTCEGKADALDAAEGRRLEGVMGECSSHHRGLRPGHVFKEVAWELGRPGSGLVEARYQGRKARSEQT
ncbi:MAG: hypothetical protein SRB2_03687 [Desulfobacteraceae bacterium Eth-SRB2]|nr:MAG: hypothetical protein SRB2_03687 [Desulfobacteraceae bacterium Eth-SRB2]